MGGVTVRTSKQKRWLAVFSVPPAHELLCGLGSRGQEATALLPVCLLWLSITIPVSRFLPVYSYTHLYIHSFQQVFDCLPHASGVGSKGEQEKSRDLLLR